MKKLLKNLKRILELNRKIKKLPKLSPIENDLLKADLKFEETYHSNRLEGNKLSIDEARKAIMS